jgi:hypothetical protein
MGQCDGAFFNDSFMTVFHGVMLMYRNSAMARLQQPTPFSGCRAILAAAGERSGTVMVTPAWT